MVMMKMIETFMMMIIIIRALELQRICGFHSDSAHPIWAHHYIHLGPFHLGPSIGPFPFGPCIPAHPDWAHPVWAHPVWAHGC